MSLVKGVFLSDIHCPDNIPLDPVLEYVKDFKPDITILGGDIVDAKGLHGVDHMPASAVDVGFYHRDIKLIRNLLTKIRQASPKTKIVYLEGNHEHRYRRLAEKFPNLFGELFNIQRDIELVNYIPYGTYDSQVVVGDCAFIHGTIWPDNHAKSYALRHTPSKVVYGHLHHYQAYTTHRATPAMSPRYAVTAGALCSMDPDWKRGAAHQWVNGFISFISSDGITVPTVHMIEGGKFNVGAKVYGAS